MDLPFLIERDSIYDDGAVYLRLGISAETLARARREARLRFTRKGSRNLYLGAWILEWIETDDKSARGERS